jgi:hypothetical protein
MRVVFFAEILVCRGLVHFNRVGKFTGERNGQTLLIQSNTQAASPH